MADHSCRLLVVGAGPGGYVCAIRAGQLGIDTIIVEEQAMGGTCLNVGCIPSKALIHAADEFHRLTQFSKESPLGISASSPAIDLSKTVAWKDAMVGRLTKGVGGLLKKAKVRAVTGRAQFLDGKTVEVTDAKGERTRISAEYVVIATGSSPVELPSLPFGGTVISSTEALSMTEVPRRLAVVGGGYIGLEIGMAYAKLGSEVTVVEATTRILPLYDAALTAPVKTQMDALGMTLLTETKATGRTDEGLAIETNDGDRRTIPADRILVTVGRRPRTKEAGIPGLDLAMDGPFIQIDEQCRTSMSGVYAIGDVTGEPLLAHRAMAQGEIVASHVAGEKVGWDGRIVPAVCFTDPEIVSCGLSADEAKAAGHDVTTGQFPFTANGRAMTMDAEAGFIRVVAKRSNSAILGIQGVGSGISELASAFSIAIEMGALAEDLGAIIQAHPTQAEALQEASLATLGHAIHI